MKYDDISSLSHLDISNDKLPFHYPISFKKNYIDNKINLEVFYNIYNNYNKNLTKNKNIDCNIQTNENRKYKSNDDEDDYNIEKNIKKNIAKHKYQFIPRRRKNMNNNLSENLSFKNNSLTNNNNSNIKNMKYNNIDKYNYNSYIIGYSNNLIDNEFGENSYIEDKIPKKQLRRVCSNSNPHSQSLIGDKKKISNIGYKKKCNSFGQKCEKKKMVLKRNKNNVINISKSNSLINKNKTKSPFNRPKSCEVKLNDNDNNIYSNFDEKQKILYNNKMSQIDKYLNVYTYNNNKNRHISYNINQSSKKKNISNENKDKPFNHIIISTKKINKIDSSIFRKNSKNKNPNNNDIISQKNTIFKKCYNSKESYWSKKEEKINNKNVKTLFDRPKKSFIINSQKRIYNCKDIFDYNSESNKNNNENKYEKMISAIHPNINGKNKKMKRFIEGICKFQKFKEIKNSETSNYFHKNNSEKYKINNLRKNQTDILNNDLKNNFFEHKRKLTIEQEEQKEENIYFNIHNNKEQYNIENKYLNKSNISQSKSKIKKTNHIPHSKLNTISSHKDIYKNNINNNNFLVNKNNIRMSTYNKFYLNKYNSEEKIINNNLSSNKEYNNYNIINNKNIFIPKNKIISYNNKSNINEINEIKKNSEFNSQILNKIKIENNFPIRNYSSFNIFNSPIQDKQDQNISDIRKYLHNYYEIKNRNNIRKNNSFNNINNYYQKEKMDNYIFKNNLLNNLIKNDEDSSTSNNYYNNLSSNVNININITPNQFSNKKIDINLTNSNSIIKKINKTENNEYNAIQILTPSFMRTKRELNNEEKINIQKINMKNAFKNCKTDENEYFQNNKINNFNDKEINNEQIRNNDNGYDYTFKNLNSINNNYLDNNINYSNYESKNHIKYNHKIDSEKRKEDINELLHFSENLRLNCNK